jgi:hypothetical protein
MTGLANSSFCRLSTGGGVVGGPTKDSEGLQLLAFAVDELLL